MQTYGLDQMVRKLETADSPLLRPMSSHTTKLKYRSCQLPTETRIAIVT